MSVYPSVSKSVFKSVHNPLKVPAALLSGGTSAPFDPDSISGVQSRILDGGTIWTDAISGKYYLKDQSTDNTHLPRQGRCWLFDGVNDYGVTTRLEQTTITMTAWVKPTGSTRRVVLACGDTGGSFSYSLEISSSNKIEALANAANVGITGTGTVANGVWSHIAVTRSGSLGNWTFKTYINGILDASSTVTFNPDSNAGQVLAVGRAGNYAAINFNGCLRDVRIYSTAKSDAEILSIYNQSLTGNGTIDSTNLVTAYPCNEESGTTGYDISGNGSHLTLTNITQATFHAADTGVLTNRNNDEGYRLSGSVYIPKRLSDSNAADGNALTVTGRAAYHGCAEVPCVTGDGSSVYIELGIPLVPETADFDLSFWYYHADSGTSGKGIFQTGNTASRFEMLVNNGVQNRLQIYSGGAALNVFATILTANVWNYITVNRTGTLFTCNCYANGSLTGTFNGTSSHAISQNSQRLFVSNAAVGYISGRVADIRTTSGGVTTYFPLQDGPGSSNTNRNLAYVKSDGTGGVVSNAIVNGTVSTIWANRVPGQVKDWCIDNGGRIGAAGEFIAGLIGSANAADGNAKTLTAGKHGNPFSRLNLNPATAAEFNGRSIPTASAVANDINAAVTPAESAFRRTDTDGDDRFLIYESALAGSDLTNVEAYVA